MIRKKIFVSIGAVIIILTAVFLLFEIYGKIKKENDKAIEKSIEEQIKENLLKSTTAPNQGREVSKELLDSATAPNQGREVSKELLDSATAPE